MRKLFAFGVLTAMLFGGVVQADEGLDNSKIYFFTHKGCPYCKMADEYISPNFAALNIEKVDIYKPGGRYLLKQCVKKFNLGREVGTPLFCMGDTYIMGWTDENKKQFDELSVKFKK